MEIKEYLNFQVQRVMSTHNNLSSTWPFIPSSTSILTVYQLSKQHQGSTADEQSGWMLTME